MNRDDPDLKVRIEDLGEPPGLEHPEALDAWLERAREVYSEYCESYRKSHEEWWKTRASHPLWTWKADRVSSSRHLGLEAVLEAIDECRRRAADLRCRGLANLDFQPACTCGFDGESSPLQDVLCRFEDLIDELEQAKMRFFGQQEVRKRLRDWVGEGLEVNPRTLAYVEGKEPYPEVENVQLFDRHLAGLELVKEIDPRQILDLLGGQLWDRGSLVREVERFVERFGDARLRFSAAPTCGPSSVAIWCVEQALRFGVSLPQGLGVPELAEAAETLRPDHVGAAALERLEELGVGQEMEDRVIRWILSEQVTAPDSHAVSPLVAAACEVLRPSEPRTTEDLAELSRGLYRHHDRLVGIEPRAWLERLDRLARVAPASPVRSLTEALEERSEAQWVVIDGLGLPLVHVLRDQLSELFPGWRLESFEAALVSEQSTTDGFYRRLLEAGINRPLEKIDCVDTLLHERFVPLDDLGRLALAELRVSSRRIRERLDPRKSVVVFADHGFRIARDGTSYQHGGPSMLERLAPVFFLAPLE